MNIINERKEGKVTRIGRIPKSIAGAGNEVSGAKLQREQSVPSKVKNLVTRVLISGG